MTTKIVLVDDATRAIAMIERLAKSMGVEVVTVIHPTEPTAMLPVPRPAPVFLKTAPSKLRGDRPYLRQKKGRK